MRSAVRRTATRAAVSFPLWLAGGARLCVEGAAGLALFPSLAAGAFVFAGWLWRRTPNLLAFPLACAGAVGGALVLMAGAHRARDAVRALRCRVDPRAAFVYHQRVAQDARLAMYARWYARARLFGGPYLPQHPGDP